MYLYGFYNMTLHHQVTVTLYEMKCISWQIKRAWDLAEAYLQISFFPALGCMVLQDYFYYFEPSNSGSKPPHHLLVGKLKFQAGLKTQWWGFFLEIYRKWNMAFHVNRLHYKQTSKSCIQQLSWKLTNLIATPAFCSILFQTAFCLMPTQQSPINP